MRIRLAEYKQRRTKISKKKQKLSENIFFIEKPN